LQPLNANHNPAKGPSDVVKNDQGSQYVTVAFIGHQGAGRNACSVLRLIKAEGADMVLHQGDSDCRDEPDARDSPITEILGIDFPYFAVVANHDTECFFGPNGCQAKLRTRLSRISGARCVGRILLGRRAANVFYMLLGRPVRPGFMSHLRSPMGYDEPKSSLRKTPQSVS